MKITSLRVGFLLAASSLLVQSQAQEWIEDFSHNNPALYTNMNGGPDNLTITEGVAHFSGAGGAFYARNELPIMIGPNGTSFLEGYAPGFGLITGTMGVGWFSPSLNIGISAKFDSETNISSLVRHDGWLSTTELVSAVVNPNLIGGDFLRYVTSNWVTAGGQFYGFPPPQKDMFFFMYGSETSSGQGAIDVVSCTSVPEPSGALVLVVGLAVILFKAYWRSRGERSTWALLTLSKPCAL